MSPAAPAGSGDAPARTPITRTFRKHSALPKLSRDQMRRQNDVLQSAWRHFKTPGPVIAFLNAQNEQLQAKPLELALHSDEGLQRVERLLGEMTYQA